MDVNLFVLDIPAGNREVKKHRWVKWIGINIAFNPLMPLIHHTFI